MKNFWFFYILLLFSPTLSCAELVVDYSPSFVEAETDGTLFVTSSPLGETILGYQPCASCPDRWVRLLSSSNTTNSGAIAFYNSRVDLSGGFETEFTLFVNNTPIGGGFTFAIRAQRPVVAGSGSQLGIRIAPSVVGLGSNWGSGVNTHVTHSILTPTENIGEIPGPILRTAPEQTLRYRIIYNKLAIPYSNGLPFLRMYVNDQIGFERSFDLSTRFLTNPGDPETAHVGFTAGKNNGQVFESYLQNWNLRTFDLTAPLVISCYGNYTLWVNGDLVGSRTGNPLRGDSFYDLPANLIGSTIAFQAIPSSSSGCMVELRSQDSQGVLIPLNSTGLWKCSTTSQDNWETPSFNDEAWAFGDILRTNSLQDPEHVPNARPWAPWIWSQDTGGSAFCRLRVPTFCPPSAEPSGASQCQNFEICENSGQCSCPPPYFGEACDQLGPPVLDSISPLFGTRLGGTPLTLSGANFSLSDMCVFSQGANPVEVPVSGELGNFDEVSCVTPPGTVGIVNVSVRRGVLQTGSVEYSYRAPITVTNISPTQSLVAEQTEVTVTGTNFVTGMLCRFGNFPPVSADYTNGNLITCPTPPGVTPGNVVLQVSDNGVDYVGNRLFRFFDIQSPFCRRDSSVDFPFGDSSEIAGSTYFPRNVAAGAQVLTIPVIPAFASQEIVDNDFCCEIEGANQGFLCGLLFNVSDSSRVELTLPSSAYVNQAVTSWFDPCRTLPLSYTLEYFSSGSWQTLLTRQTSGNNTCNVIPSDNGAAAICLSYFTPVISTRFAIEFDNDAPISEEFVGAWLYEFALQGKFLNEPHTWGVSTASSWNNPPNSYSSAAQVVLNNFDLSLFSIDGSTLPSSAASFPVTVRLFRNGVDVSERILEGSRLRTFEAGVFNGLTLIRPPQGDYSLRFQSPLFENINLPFSVTPGTPVSFTFPSEEEVIVVSDVEVQVPLQICLSDISGNVASTSVLRPITLTVTGTLPVDVTIPSVSLTVGQSCVDFTFTMSRPLTGANPHSILFEAAGFSPLEIPFRVVEGFPASISFVSRPSTTTDNFRPLTVQPLLRVLDSVGNVVGSNSPVSVTGLVSGETRDVTQPTVLVVGGEARFTSFGFVRRHGETYTVTFRVNNYENVNVTHDIRVLNCTEISSDTVLSPDGLSCACGIGFQVRDALEGAKCEPCPEDTFKSLPSDTPCSSCPPLRSTYELTGRSRCDCVSGYVEDPTLGCITCPEGGVCRRGIIVGTAPGYTRPSWASGDSIEFYPCYRGSPSTRELEAAELACPGNATSLTPECGEGYTGTRCLVCAEDYGNSGPFCEECPSPVITLVVLAIALVVLLAFLIFLVYQGRTPKNKESVSTKILLNHVQMLALLSAVGAAWTNPFQTLLTIGGAASFVDTRLISTNCIFTFSYYTQLGFFMILPFAMVFVSFVVHVFIYLFKAFVLPCFCVHNDLVVRRGALRSSLFSQFVLSCAVLTFMSYPAICIKVLDMFDCSIQVEDRSYLNVAPEVECGTSTYNFWLIFVYLMLVIYCLGVPIFSAVMLWKFKKSPNKHIQMVMRFIYDGFKPKRDFWEIVILFRKFLLVVALIVGRINGTTTQIYGFLWIVQASLLMHIILHPYVSGRQFRLELWSLLVILITLCISLFIPTIDRSSPLAFTLSGFALLLNLVLIVGFVFFISRGLLRRFALRVWKKIAELWKKISPKTIKKTGPELNQTLAFFKMVADSSEYDRELLFASLERWWAKAPNYKRRRLMTVLATLSKSTPFEKFPIKEPSTISRSSISVERVEME